jgi:hypothetical protein
LQQLQQLPVTAATTAPSVAAPMTKDPKPQVEEDSNINSQEEHSSEPSEESDVESQEEHNSESSEESDVES